MKIIAESHTDHVSPEVLEFIKERFKDEDAQLRIETVVLPSHLKATCGLYGPVMGDSPIEETEVFYATRPDRDWTSRLVNRPSRDTDKITVIYGHYAPHGCCLFTVYGGPLAPMEPGDPRVTDTVRKQCEDFWKQHALSS